MKNFKRSFRRSLYSNRNKGIPNLMLWIAVGNLVVLFLRMMDPSGLTYQALYFYSSAILQGEVWRLFTFVFTELAATANSSLFWGLISLFIYYQLGTALEQYWGTLKFNLYYVTGMLLQGIYLLIFSAISGMPMTGSASYLNLSLFLAYATINPDARFLIFYIIPIKARWLAIVDLVLVAADMVDMLYQVIPLQYWPAIVWALYPLVSLGNYWLYLGRDVTNLFPLSWRVNASRVGKKRGRTARPAANNAAYLRSQGKAASYLHKCTVCGKTDAQNPDLEFRYCSKCKGYYCYCAEHINQHIHIQ